MQCHFLRASHADTRAGQCHGHLCAEIIRRFDLSYDRLPARTVEDSGFLEKVLREAVEKSAQPLWLVVDAIDEGDAVPGRNALSLPARLPESVYCFVTQRPGETVLAADPDTPIADETLTWDSALQQADVAAYLEREAGQPALAGGLKTSFPGEARQSVLDRLGRLSEGNFMYLRYVLSDIAAGQFAAGSPKDQTDLPRGLQGYYAVTWSRMKAEIENHDGGSWKALHRPVLGLLAVAAEPVTIDWLAALSGCEVEDIQDGVLNKWRRFFNSNGGLWRILHRSLADFLAKQLDLKARHARVAGWLEDSARWGELEGYALRHRSMHLRQAEDLPGMMRLVGDAGWYERQVALDPSGVRYATDLRAALELTSRIDREATAGGSRAPALAEEVRLALTLSTLSDHWTSIPVSTLNALINAGILTEAQVLDLIQGQDESIRGNSLASVASYLPPPLLGRALELAAPLKAEPKTRVLLSLSEVAAESVRPELLQAARAAALEIDDDNDSKAELVFATRAGSGSGDGDSLQSLGLEFVFRTKSPFRRAAQLAPLVGRVTGALPQLLEALQEAAAPENADGVEDDGLLDIVRAVPDQHRAEAARAAVAVALGMGKPTEKAAALSGLARVLPQAERTAVVLTALDVVRSLPDEEEPAQHLFELAAAVDGSERELLLKEAQAVIFRAGDPGTLAAGLLRLSSARGDARRSQLQEQALDMLEDMDSVSAQHALLSSAEYLDAGQREEVLNVALQHALNSNSRFEQARRSIQVAEHWSEDKVRDIVRSLARAPAGILAIGELPDDTGAQAELLAACLPFLSGAAADDVLITTRGHLAFARNAFERGCIRLRLLSALSPADQISELQEIREEADALEFPDQRAELLAAMAEHSAEPERGQLLAEAVEHAREIQGAGFSGLINMRTAVITVFKPSSFAGLASLAILRIATLSPNEQRGVLLCESLDRAFDLSSDQQVRVLLALARFLSGSQIRDVVARYRSVLSDPLRSELHDALRGFLGEEPATIPQSENPSDSEAVRGDEDEKNYMQFTVELRGPPGAMYTLRRGSDQSFIRISFSPEPEPSEGAVDESLQRKIVRACVPGMVARAAPENPRELVRQGHALREGSGPRCIAVLLRELSRRESADAALRLAHEVWGDRIPPVAAAMLANIAGKTARSGLVSSALTFARGAGDPIEKAMAICHVLPCLDAGTATSVAAELGELSRTLSVRDTANLLQWMDIKDLPDVAILTLIQVLLQSECTRKSRLEMLVELIPLLERLGGPVLIQSLPKILEDAVTCIH